MRRSHADPGFARGAIGWMVALAIGSFAVHLAMSAFGEDLVEPVTAAPSTFSFSALGHRSLVTHLEERGVPVLVRQDPAGAHGGPRVPELFAEPDVSMMREQDTSFAVLLASARRHGAPAVIVLPKWIGVPDESRSPPWIGDVALVALDDVERVLTEAAVDELAELRVFRVDRLDETCDGHAISLENAQLFGLRRSSTVEPVVSCGPGVLVARLPGGEGRPDVWLASDPDLLSNHGLSRAGHAALADDLFLKDLGAQALVTDEAIHGLRRRVSLLRQLTRFPLVLCSLHGTFVLGLALWAGFGRFGKPMPLPAGHVAGKDALIENTAQLLELGGHTSDTLQRYLAEAVSAAASHHLIPSETPPAQIHARLQAITGSKRLAFRLDETRRDISALGERTAASRARALRIARAIHEWRRGMTDER